MLSQIADVCRWYAADGPRTARRQAAALAELAHVTGGRTDLLSRYAGQSLAWHDTGPDNTVHERAVQLCITAGATWTSSSAGAAKATGARDQK